MELNQKCIEILQSLRDSNDFIKISDLAESYGVTDRAIRYSIDKIEEFLVKNGFGYLEKEHNKGIKLINRNGLDEFIDSFINSHTPYKYFFSSEERFVYIIVKLLLADNPLTSEYFRQKLYTSKNTILKELYSVEKWLLARELVLEKKHKVGVWVEGKEISKRRAVSELTLRAMTAKDILYYLETKTVQSKIINLLFEEIFGDIDISLLDDLIKQAENDLGRKFSDKSYCQLIIHLAIVLKRGNKGVDTLDLKVENMKGSIEFKTAKAMVNRLKDEVGSHISPGETGHLMLYLLGAEVIKSDKKEGLRDYLHTRARWDELYVVVKQMTDEMEQMCGINFGKEKSQIIGGLVTHLRSAIYRIKYGLIQANPAYDEVRNECNEIFLQTKLVVRHLEEYIKERVDDQEISYLVMHFVAAIERSKRVVHDKTRVIIVCGTGIGTASMLAYRLMNEFNVKVVDTVSCRGFSSIKESKYDLIISTVEIPGVAQERYIKVHPFLGEEDYKKLQDRLNRRFSHTLNFELSLVNKLIGIVEKYAEITDKQQLQYEMMYEIKRNIKSRMERRFVYMLNDLLTWDTIKLNLDCTDWKEAITAGTALLEEKRYITSDYKKAIISNFDEFGPYMVVAPGIALAHARPENGVKKLSMSLITLKNSVKFGHELNDPVKMVVTLAAVNNASHLKALSQLMELFMNQEDLNGLMKAGNKEEVIEVIRKYAN